MVLRKLKYFSLRHITTGYWKIVSEFTHKDCIKEIKRLSNITTDLGRGKASKKSRD